VKSPPCGAECKGLIDNQQHNHQVEQTFTNVEPIKSPYMFRSYRTIFRGSCNAAHTRSIMLRKIILRNTSLPIHDQVNQHHTRSIMLHNTQCCATWLIVYGPLNKSKPLTCTFKIMSKSVKNYTAYIELPHYVMHGAILSSTTCLRGVVVLLGAHSRSIMLRNIVCCATGWPCMVLIDNLHNLLHKIRTVLIFFVQHGCCATRLHCEWWGCTTCVNWNPIVDIKTYATVLKMSNDPFAYNYCSQL
jgi:hypothetical protein